MRDGEPTKELAYAGRAPAAETALRKKRGRNEINKRIGGTGDPVSDSGAACVFTRDASGAWAEQAVLRAEVAEVLDRFGHSVAISGDTAVVGAYFGDGVCE